MTVDDEAARYREAARLALQQLDWCVVYLNRISKRQLANALAKNTSAIAGRLADIQNESR
jgi:hypothetical protein